MKAWLVILFVCACVGGGWMWMDAGGMKFNLQIPKTGSDVDAAVRRWMDFNVPDKNAEILVIGEPPVVFDGKFYRLCRVRAKNGFGAPVINDLMVVGSAKDDVMDVMSPERWVKSFDLESLSAEERLAVKEVAEKTEKIALETAAKNGLGH